MDLHETQEERFYWLLSKLESIPYDHFVSSLTYLNSALYSRVKTHLKDENHEFLYYITGVLHFQGEIVYTVPLEAVMMVLEVMEKDRRYFNQTANNAYRLIPLEDRVRLISIMPLQILEKGLWADVRYRWDEWDEESVFIACDRVSYQRSVLPPLSFLWNVGDVEVLRDVRSIVSSGDSMMDGYGLLMSAAERGDTSDWHNLVQPLIVSIGTVNEIVRARGVGDMSDVLALLAGERIGTTIAPRHDIQNPFIQHVILGKHLPILVERFQVAAREIAENVTAAYYSIDINTNIQLRMGDHQREYDKRKNFRH